jgi:hypothetical protein
MPPSTLEIRQGNLWVRVNLLKRKFKKHRLFTEQEFEELHQELKALDEDLMKLKNDIYS